MAFFLKIKKRKTASASKGVTLIELLIVIFIIALISSITMLNYKGFGKDFNLERSVQGLAQEIRNTLEMSISTKNIGGSDSFENFKGGYGLYFDMNNPVSYIIFADINNDKEYDSGDQIIKKVNFESGVKISTTSPSSLLSIVFFPPDPKIYINGDIDEPEATITLQLIGDTLKLKSLTIKTTGMVEINEE